MNKPALLDEHSLNEQLQRYKGWEHDASAAALSKRFRFHDYAQSFAFVSYVSMCAQALDHHPDVRFGWGYASITTTTHDAKGITARDCALVTAIEKYNHKD